LSGYGGSSKIHVGPDQILIPKRNATFWTCKIYLENHGNVDGFVCVQPFHGKKEKDKLFLTASGISKKKKILMDR